MSKEGGYKIDLGAPDYNCNAGFFQVIMNNLMLIDGALAGAEGYDKVNVPLLVDSLIGKVLNADKKAELKKLKKDSIKKAVDGIVDKEARHEKILEVTMDVYGECVEYYGKYLTFEQKLGVMIS